MRVGRSVCMYVWKGMYMYVYLHFFLAVSTKARKRTKSAEIATSAHSGAWQKY